MEALGAPFRRVLQVSLSFRRTQLLTCNTRNKRIATQSLRKTLVFEYFMIMKILNTNVKESELFSTVDVPAICRLTDKTVQYWSDFMQVFYMEIYVFGRP